MDGPISTPVILVAAALAGAFTGLFAALLAVRLWQGSATAASADPERLAALERRCAALESDALARVDNVEARMTAWRAQAHGIATVLRNLADAQRKAERAAEQRSATLIRRAGDQVEHLADRVFTLEARLADPPQGRDPGARSVAPEPARAPPAPERHAAPAERLGGTEPPAIDPPATDPDPDPDPPGALDVAGLPSRVVSVIPR